MIPFHSCLLYSLSTEMIVDNFKLWISFRLSIYLSPPSLVFFLLSYHNICSTAPRLSFYPSLIAQISVSRRSLFYHPLFIPFISSIGLRFHLSHSCCCSFHDTRHTHSLSSFFFFSAVLYIQSLSLSIYCGRGPTSPTSYHLAKNAIIFLFVSCLPFC